MTATDVTPGSGTTDPADSTAATPVGRRRNRLIGGGLALLLLIAIVAIGPRGGAGPPLDPRSTGPAGIKGLVDVLEELGVAVSVGRGLPAAADSAALVISDRTTDGQRDGLLDWVADGGTLVVADPLSELAPDLMGLTSIAFTEPTIEPACEDRAVRGVDRVNVIDGFVFDLAADAIGCFPRNDGFWMVRQGRGDGQVVSLGGPFTLTNDLLDAADNAVLLVNLLTTDEDPRVRIVEGDDPDGGDADLGDVLPDQVALALLQLPVVWLGLIWWRARRLGHPVREVPPVRLDAAETTLAVGNLMQRAGLARDAAQVIRDHLMGDVHQRLGIPEDLAGDDLVGVIADRTGSATDALRQVLLAPLPMDDDGLTRFANAAAHLRHSILDHRRGGPPTDGPGPAAPPPAPLPHAAPDQPGASHP